MKAILFCKNPYAYGILLPLCEELVEKGHVVLWFTPAEMANNFPFREKYPVTSSIRDLIDFSSEAIFVPGNEVPHYIPGVKIQVFHGFAGEKKGHFRIRNYFDLYLTQGPYFTARFRQLARKYGNFRVAETGWCKLDPLFKERNIQGRKETGPVTILYAPTFSPSFTSAVAAFDNIIKLAEDKRFRIIVKFHDLTDSAIIEKYKKAASGNGGIEIASERNILPVMLGSDILISDTSSVVYEFLLLDRPVITIGSKSPHIRWVNIENPAGLPGAVDELLQNDKFSAERRWFSDNYHPYSDGKSSERMIDEAINYIERYGVPDRRKLSLARRMKINRMFGKKP